MWEASIDANRARNFACSEMLTAAIAVPPINAVQTGKLARPAHAVAIEIM
jgi:hypothetical protein